MASSGNLTWGHRPEVHHAALWVCRDGEQQPQASTGQSGSQGSMTDEDGNASGSWLVDDAEDGGLVAVEGSIT